MNPCEPAFGISAQLVIWVGCNSGEHLVLPVHGQVEVSDGDISQLVGSHVEFLDEANPEIRPSGKLNAAGEFALETLLGGRLLTGAPQGKYKVRLVLSEESGERAPKRKAEPVNRRFLDFESSGLLVTVPSDDLRLVVTKR